MIRLKAQARPAELTEEYVKKFTEKFKLGTTKWESLNRKVKAAIKRDLKTMSDGKCAYCERDKAGHLHIEHFHDKEKYREEVLLWKNLLLACHFCNTDNKRTHDTKEEPIIHPVRDVPREHIKFYYYFFKTTTPLGKITVKVLDLNNEDLQLDRYKVGQEVTKQLDLLAEDLTDVSKKYDIRNRLRAIMRLCTPSAAFAATTSTVLLNDVDYHKIKTFLQTQDLWNEDFDELEAQVQYCTLDLANSRSHPDTVAVE